MQLACLSMCSPGVSLDHIYSAMLALLGAQLRRLGVVKASASEVEVLKVRLPGGGLLDQEGPGGGGARGGGGGASGQLLL